MLGVYPTGMPGPGTEKVMSEQEVSIGRVERRRMRNLEALIAAGQAVMAEKGIDAATMHEIAERADIGAGTVYSFFRSKDDLAMAVLERLMTDLAKRIERVTESFEDPGQVYAFGVRTVILTATGDRRWRQLLLRSEVLADAMYRQMGPFAMRDLEKASQAGRFRVHDVQVTFRMACHAMVGLARAITTDGLADDAVDEGVIAILCMTGIGRDDATELAHRFCPPLPEA